ncbi:DUF4185 domain-containing protein [Mycolicibacterium baixiangningiae]|uniref:DUF4185 domain-containing protein n=1 Tax=Mycolicibacterium baixiangningiae TaxID=2761578 RepID=UPI0018671DF3|nr:DUF4185 domain-containing protein [Mycolicibacterium baixiangningiae]
MKPNTSAAAHVGRIGALAVALGVGAAVTFGHGVAVAETSDSGTSSSASASESSASESSAESSVGQKDSTDSATAPDDGDDSSEDDTEAVDDDASEDELADDEVAEDDSAEGEAVDTVDDEPDSGDVLTELPVEEPTDTVDTEPVTENPTPAADPQSTSDQPEAPRESTDEADEVVDDQPVAEDVPLDDVPPAAPEIPVATRGATPSETTTGTQRPTASTTSAVAATPTTRVMPVDPPSLPAMISGFLAAVGLAPLAAALPTAPAPPPALWAMLALARREFERAFTRPNISVAPSGVVTAAAAIPFPTTLPSVDKGWVTGKVPNNFGIGGTDLGIMWDGGTRLGERFVHVAFGDTFANANMTGDWRSNVLLISTDHKLGNGLQLVQTGYAGRFIGPYNGRLGLFGSEVTQIPTSGIQIDGRQFVNFMSVKSWDTPGRWTTNYSAISVYDQATDTWVLAPSTIRSAGWFRSSTRYVPGSQNFQQAAYVLQPEDQVGEDGVRYLYAFGTPSGRAGSAYVSRVAEGSVTDLSKYEYWDGSKWVANRPAAAAPIIGDSKRSAGLFGFAVDWANDPNVLGGYLGGLFGAKTGGNVSEMSVQYNEYLGKYVVLYGDGNNDIQLRTADTPEGPWSSPVTIATSAKYPGLYAPMIHPWSGTGDLKDANNQPDLNNLYWNMSLWGDYNVTLMQTDLSPLKSVSV